jgi:hypothetical protein
MKEINDMGIIVEEEWLDEYKMETACISPIAPDIGVLVASKTDQDY